MFFLLELLVIVSYLLSNKLGLLVSCVIYFIIFFLMNIKKSFFNKILIALIFAVPTFNLSVLGTQFHHVFSWINIFFTLLIIMLIKKNLKFKNRYLIYAFISIGIILINCFRRIDIKNEIFEWFEIALMYIPIILVFSRNRILKIEMDSIENDEYFINIINSTILATAVAVYFQAILYYVFNIKVGNWTFYWDRTVIDLVFAGASVLSIFLGIGVVINFTRLCEKFKFRYLIYIALCMMAIILNSSRTGLAASVIVCIIILLKNMLKSRKKFLYTCVTIPIIIVIVANIISTLLSKRHTNTLFDENGRFETYRYGISVFAESIGNILFGNGLSQSNYTNMLPHNFILESLVTVGIIPSIVIFIQLIYLLFFLKNNKYKYILWTILIGSMFITNFQGNLFFTVYTIVLILNNYKLEEKTMNVSRLGS